MVVVVLKLAVVLLVVILAGRLNLVFNLRIVLFFFCAFYLFPLLDSAEMVVQRFVSCKQVRLSLSISSQMRLNWYLSFCFCFRTFHCHLSLWMQNPVLGKQKKKKYRVWCKYEVALNYLKSCWVELIGWAL